MSTVQDLVLASDHHQISQLDDTYAPYKCVAFIHLDMFDKAIQYALPDSFEYFYCLYKLKKYKKCIRSINKTDQRTERINVVLAQSLYHLGYYTASYRILSKIKSTAVAINLRAALSLVQASKTRKIHRFAVFGKDNEDVDEIPLKKGTLDSDDLVEYEYNKCFEHLTSEKEFIGVLEEKVTNILCMIQLNNILGNYDDINPEILSSRQSEIINANRNNAPLPNPVHFQKENREYEVFSGIKENGFSEEAVVNVHGTTEMLKILKMYSDVKKGKISQKKIDGVRNERTKRILTFLNMRGKVGQDSIRNIIEMVNFYKKK